MTIRSVIFDLDGTLLDTLQDVADSVNAALMHTGLPTHDLHAYKYFVGDGRRMMAIRALPPNMRDEPTLTGLLDKINEEYMQRWMTNTRPYPGVPELLDSLATRGIRIAILTNKPQNYTEAMVVRLLGKWHFEYVIGDSPAFPRKPDPTAARHIIEQMTVLPEECFFVGDSSIDMETAVAAHLYPVGVLWGFRTRDELLSSGAQALVHHPAEIVELLDSSCP